MRAPVLPIALLALAVAGAVVPQDGSSPQTSTPADRPTVRALADETCADVLLLAAGGGGERITDRDPAGATIGRVVRTYASAARQGGRTVETRYLALDAPGPKTLKATPTYQGPAETGVRRGRVADWARGVADGVVAAKSALATARAACPEQQVLLAGYSQGAMVMHRTLLGLEAQGTDLPRLVGAVLVSDGDRRAATRAALLGSPAASRAGLGVNTAKRRAVPDAPGTGRGYRVWSVCTAGDVVCDLRGNPIRDAIALSRSYDDRPGRKRVRVAARQAWERTTAWPLPLPASAVGYVGLELVQQLRVDVDPQHEASVRWEVVEGLPQGMTLDPSTGRLGGKPTAAGEYRVVYTVRNVSDPAVEHPVTGAATVTVNAAARSEATAGGGQSCQIRADGSLWCWGANLYGQLGDGTTSRRLKPTLVAEAGPWSSVSSGGSTTCAVKGDGTLWCWGLNHRGQVGDGTRQSRRSPQQIGTATSWASVSTGYFHSCATRTDGALFCWGANQQGQLGVGDTSTRGTPKRVGDTRDWATVAVGGTHTCGIRLDGSAWCWGANDMGQIGDGTRGGRRLTPVRVGTANGWIDVSASWLHTCGVNTAGEVRCWGDNRDGQLGDGTTLLRLSPTKAVSEASYVDVATGQQHTCAVATDRTAWCWGTNQYGQLGTAGTSMVTAPRRVDTDPVLAQVTASWLHSCGTRPDGRAVCWGANETAQLGTGDLEDSSTPVFTRQP